MIQIVLAVLMVTLAAAPARAEIYFWTDKAGVKHFSNVHPPRSTSRPGIAKETKAKPKAKAATTPGRRFKVLAVYDGDSIKVKDAHLTLMVRLAGIDAPETGRGTLPGQPFSRESKRLLKKMVAGKTVTIKSHGMGSYNRQLAEVFVKEVNVNLALLQAGLAEVYRGKTVKGIDRKRYRKAEADARRRLRGIWSLGSRYQSPRAWRRQHPRK
ncbi:MAG: DUF4124 domain-containing protein [Desulfobacteraceae bacterium]|nr:DUF4124 domain-containing protein [Desulfobacteraceae bacterium]